MWDEMRSTCNEARDGKDAMAQWDMTEMITVAEAIRRSSVRLV